MEEHSQRRAAAAADDATGRVRLVDRLLIEWVAQAKVGDPFPEPWRQASDPAQSIIRTLIVLGVIDRPAPDAPPADVARAAQAAARDWLAAHARER